VKLYEDDVPGRRIVRNLCALRRVAATPGNANSAAGAVLVHFHDSQDLYELDLSAGSLKLLASAALSTGTLGLVSGLGFPDHYGVRYGDRQGVGYSYTLLRGYRVAPAFGSASGPPVVTLVDSNRDGEIDVVLQLTEADFKAQGWQSLENYDNWWLN